MKYIYVRDQWPILLKFKYVYLVIYILHSYNNGWEWSNFIYSANEIIFNPICNSEYSNLYFVYCWLAI